MKMRMMRKWMTERSERCIHDLLTGQCSFCMKPPWGINPIVYTTKGGDSFHNWNECKYLASGQDYAYSQGMNNHPINPVQWSAIQDKRSPCEWCCAIFLAGIGGMKKCKANIDGVWIDALFAKSSYDGIRQKTNQILDPKTGLVYFLSNGEVKL
jgi:hypothetical protein